MSPEQYAERVTTCDEGIEALRKCDRAALERLVALVVREAIAEEQEACLADVAGALSDEGTDDPHQALKWAADAIRARAGP